MTRILPIFGQVWVNFNFQSWTNIATKENPILATNICIDKITLTSDSNRSQDKLKVCDLCLFHYSFKNNNYYWRKKKAWDPPRTSSSSTRTQKWWMCTVVKKSSDKSPRPPCEPLYSRAHPLAVTHVRWLLKHLSSSTPCVSFFTSIPVWWPRARAHKHIHMRTHTHTCT